MTTITMSSKHQITLPKKTVELHGFKKGQKLVLIDDGDTITLVKIKDIKEMAGIAKGMTTDDIRDHHDRFD